MTVSLNGRVHIYGAIHFGDNMWSSEWKLIVQFCFIFSYPFVVIGILPFVPIVYVTFTIHLGNTEDMGPEFFHKKQKPYDFFNMKKQ